VKAVSLVLLLLAAACATQFAHAARDVFGVRPEERKASVHAKLAAVGTLQREEANRQEVWAIRDPRYRGAIVGYDAESRVRFITAVARDDGTPVRYADVLDLAAATHRTAGATHNYRWRPPHADYTIIAIGSDPERLTYLTLTKDNDAEAEEDD